MYRYDKGPLTKMAINNAAQKIRTKFCQVTDTPVTEELPRNSETGFPIITGEVGKARAGFSNLDNRKALDSSPFQTFVTRQPLDYTTSAPGS